MSKHDDGFDDFCKFSLLTGNSGGCLVNALSIIGVLVLLICIIF